MLPKPFDDQPSQIKAKTAITYVVLITANVAGWTWALIAFVDRPILLGTAFLAYMFGLRHAFDADHIAAIDNVVRKLMWDGKSPYSVGFFFSLGHSTIVVIASVAIAATAAVMQSNLDAFHNIGGVIGTTVSALFLLIIGIANLFILKGIWSAFARARRGEIMIDEDLDTLLAGRGLLARVFRPVFHAVSRSWHIYPIGFLFGLGFDTATEIGEEIEENCGDDHGRCGSPIRRVEFDSLGELALPAVAVRQQTVLVVIQLLAGFGRKLEVRTFDDGVDRAGLLAQPAIDAFDHVDVVAGGAPRAVVASRAGLDGRPVSRSDRARPPYRGPTGMPLGP
jgi:hypothetical protein